MKRSHLLSVLLSFLLFACQPSGQVNTENGVQGQGFLGVSDTLLFQENALAGRDRENWQKPQMVIARLGDLSDKTVADIGAGTGYFSIRLARKADKVIAIDINPDNLADIDRRISKARDRSHLNVETRLTETDDPSLKPGEADMVLIVNTYPYIQDRVEYFSKVLSGLAKGGSLVVIDFKSAPLPVGPALEDKLHHQQVVAELDSAGFEHLIIDTTSLQYQYTVTAIPPSDPTSL